MSAKASPLAAVAFSSAAHSFSHLFEPIFFVVALVLPTEMGLSYEATLALIIGGKILFGVAAPAMGWLGDRWSSLGMMAVFFIGVGASAILTGLAQSPWQVAAALTLLGLFGSIYHPVGIAWLVANAKNQGKALGVNGFFGALGTAVAGVVAGGLIAWQGWRAAFVLPGAVVLLTGLVFVWLMHRGVVAEARITRSAKSGADRADTIRAALVLAVTMVCGGMIYQATQAGLPKLFEEGLDNLGIVGIGGGVTLVYLVAGAFQIVVGHLVDRFPLKYVYAGAYLAQIPLLLLAAAVSGLPLLVVALMMVTLNVSGLVPENVLLARYAPPKWRGTAYGMKFVLAFGVSGLGVPLVSVIRGAVGEVALVFAVLAIFATVVTFAALLLPAEGRKAPVPVPDPAPAAE